MYSFIHQQLKSLRWALASSPQYVACVNVKKCVSEKCTSIFTAVPLATASLSHRDTQGKRFWPISVNSHLLKVTQYVNRWNRPAKIKVKVDKGSRGIATSIPNPCFTPTKETWHPLNKGMGGLQNNYERFRDEKNPFPLQGFKLWIVKPLA